MKGPFERLKYDMRRVWECPQCKHRERTNGVTTARFCHCQEEQGKLIAMHLVEEGGRRKGT